MCRRTSAVFCLLAILVPSATFPCGGDPCYRTGYGDAADVSGRIVRPYDWRYQRLPALLCAYHSEACQLVTGRDADPASLPATRETYEAAVGHLFKTLGTPAPVLPQHAAESQAWDGVCARNDFESATRFLGAFVNDPALVPHAESLVSWRTRLVGLCPAQVTQVDALIDEIRLAAAAKPSIRDAAGYVTGAAHFYVGRGDDAAAAFEAISRSGHAWVRETAVYMRGRALLVAAQKEWDGYSDFSRIDRAKLAAARAAFRAYVVAYPQGRYVASAEGMARRVAYLAGDGAELNRLIGERFTRLYAAKDFREIDRTALVEITEYLDVNALTAESFPFDDPLLAATLRPHVPAINRNPAVALDRLARARARYAPYPGLYELIAVPLLAGAGKPEAITLAAPANAPQPVRLGVLYERAAALEAQSRHAEARTVLRDLARELPGLGLDDGFVGDILRLHLADGRFGDAFADGSPLRSGIVAQDLFERVASEDTLRALAAGTGEGPAAAARELMFRMLRQGRWRDFLALYDKASRPVPFTEVETAARTLARDGTDPKSLFNAGFFLHQRHGSADFCCPCKQLAETPPVSAEAGRAPIALYVEALTRLAGHPDNALEAKVLHHAIMCFKESSDAVACRRGAFNDVQQGTRAGWFRVLKTKHAASAWAAKTPYYY